MTEYDTLRPVQWQDGRLKLLDQRLLPHREEWVLLREVEAVRDAISAMVVRGAPAIGCTAAYGMSLAAANAPDDIDAFRARLEADMAVLKGARPTAVNLAWAVDRVAAVVLDRLSDGVTAARSAALEEAHAITLEDVQFCKNIGKNSLRFIPEGARILTHCNAGALATAGYGTALGVARAAAEAGRLKMVFADETRPRQQGARLTAWELQHDGLPVTVIADTVAGSLMARGEIDLVVVGADRIAANGDAANKIGTYQVAVLAAYHEIPFFVAAPLSTIDYETATGAGIPIEERDPDEVAVIDGSRFVPEGVPCRNPAFDVTPAGLIRAIITDRGVAEPPGTAALAALRNL
ncbi:MAG: S-methyl-5-thioribose-1-phosphate isomerase [bacterium]